MRQILDWFILIMSAGVVAYILILLADPLAGWIVQNYVRK